MRNLSSSRRILLSVAAATALVAGAAMPAQAFDRSELLGTGTVQSAEQTVSTAGFFQWIDSFFFKGR